MAIKLYGHPASLCTRRVLLVLAEKGIDYEFINVNFIAGEQKVLLFFYSFLDLKIVVRNLLMRKRCCLAKFLLSKMVHSVYMVCTYWLEHDYAATLL
jgi:hypothetical protein